MNTTLKNIFTAATLSDRGLVREDNQDSLLCLPARGFFAVADGMGGGEGGALASRWTCDALEQAAGAWEGILAALDAAHARIIQYAEERRYRTMGTTVALVQAAADGRTARIAWLGDSRIYRLRAGEIERLTDDHTLGFELSRAVAGTAAAQTVAARRHPLAHVLTRAIGVGQRPQPEIREIELRAGDRYLICSDGVHDLLEPEDLKEALATAEAEAAIAAVAALVRARGAHDNFSMVCFDVREA